MYAQNMLSYSDTWQDSQRDSQRDSPGLGSTGLGQTRGVRGVQEIRVRRIAEIAERNLKQPHTQGREKCISINVHLPTRYECESLLFALKNAVSIRAGFQEEEEGKNQKAEGICSL